MAINKAKKKEILDEVKKIVKDSSSLVFVNFHGLRVADITSVRRGLRKGGVGYFVAKKTLIKKALDEAKIEGTIPSFEGELALVYGKDSVAPAREIYTFQKKFKDSLKIVGGTFEGKFQGKEEMISIASIPPVDVLRGMFVNVINSPIQGFVLALNEIGKKKA